MSRAVIDPDKGARAVKAAGPDFTRADCIAWLEEDARHLALGADGMERSHGPQTKGVAMLRKRAALGRAAAAFLRERAV